MTFFKSVVFTCFQIYVSDIFSCLDLINPNNPCLNGDPLMDFDFDFGFNFDFNFDFDFNIDFDRLSGIYSMIGGPAVTYLLSTLRVDQECQNTILSALSGQPPRFNFNPILSACFRGRTNISFYLFIQLYIILSSNLTISTHYVKLKFVKFWMFSLKK